MTSIKEQNILQYFIIVQIIQSILKTNTNIIFVFIFIDVGNFFFRMNLVH